MTLYVKSPYEGLVKGTVGGKPRSGNGPTTIAIGTSPATGTGQSDQTGEPTVTYVLDTGFLTYDQYRALDKATRDSQYIELHTGAGGAVSVVFFDMLSFYDTKNNWDLRPILQTQGLEALKADPRYQQIERERGSEYVTYETQQATAKANVQQKAITKLSPYIEGGQINVTKAVESGLKADLYNAGISPTIIKRAEAEIAKAGNTRQMQGTSVSPDEFAKGAVVGADIPDKVDYTSVWWYASRAIGINLEPIGAYCSADNICGVDPGVYTKVGPQDMFFKTTQIKKLKAYDAEHGTNYYGMLEEKGLRYMSKKLMEDIESGRTKVLVNTGSGGGAGSGSGTVTKADVSEFEATHKKLLTGEWIWKSQYTAIKEYDEEHGTNYHGTLYRRGVEAFQKRWDADHVTLGDGSQVTKDQWEAIKDAKRPDESLPTYETIATGEGGGKALTEAVEADRQTITAISEIGAGLDPYKTKNEAGEDTYNVVAALYDGYSKDKLLEAFPDYEKEIGEVDDAVTKAKSTLSGLEAGKLPAGKDLEYIIDKSLKPFLTEKEYDNLTWRVWGINEQEASAMGPVPESITGSKAERTEQLLKDLASLIKKKGAGEQFAMLTIIGESPKTWDLVKRTAISAIPVYGTIRYWDEMSTPWKVVSVIGDALVVIPLIKAATSPVLGAVRSVPVLGSTLEAPIFSEVIAPAIQRIPKATIELVGKTPIPTKATRITLQAFDDIGEVKGIVLGELTTDAGITAVREARSVALVVTGTTTVGEVYRYLSPAVVSTTTKMSPPILRVEELIADGVRGGLSFTKARANALATVAKESAMDVRDISSALASGYRQDIAVAIANTRNYLSKYSAIQVSSRIGKVSASEAGRLAKYIAREVKTGISYSVAKTRGLADIASQKLGLKGIKSLIEKIEADALRQTDEILAKDLKAGVGYNKSLIKAVKKIPRAIDAEIARARTSIETALRKTRWGKKAYVGVNDIRAYESLVAKYVDKGEEIVKARAQAVKDIVNRKILYPAEYKLNAPSRIAWERRMDKLLKGQTPQAMKIRDLLLKGDPLTDISIAKTATRKLRGMGVEVVDGKVIRLPDGEVVTVPEMFTKKLRTAKWATLSVEKDSGFIIVKPNKVIGRVVLEGEKIVDPETGRLILADPPRLSPVTATEVARVVERDGLLAGVNLYGAPTVSRLYPDTAKILSNPVFLHRLNILLRQAKAVKARGVETWERNMGKYVDEALGKDIVMEEIPKVSDLTEKQLTRQLLAEEEFIADLKAKGILRTIDREASLKQYGSSAQPVNVPLSEVLARAETFDEATWRYLFNKEYMKRNGVGTAELSVIDKLTYEHYLERTGLIKQIPAREKFLEYFPVARESIETVTPEGLYPIFGGGGGKGKILTALDAYSEYAGFMVKLSPKEVSDRLIETITQGQASTLTKSQVATLERGAVDMTEALQKVATEIETQQELEMSPTTKRATRRQVAVQEEAVADAVSDLQDKIQVLTNDAVKIQESSDVKAVPATETRQQIAVSITEVIAQAINAVIAQEVTQTAPVAEGLKTAPVVPPILPKLDVHHKDYVFPKGTKSWKQGMGWWSLIPPYEPEDRVFTLHKPRGAEIHGDAKSAIGTIQAIGGPNADKLKMDMGIMDVHLGEAPQKPDKSAGKKAIRFVRDTDKTYSGVSVKPRSQRGGGRKTGPYYTKGGGVSRRRI